MGDGPRLAALNRHEIGTDAFDPLCFDWAVGRGRVVHNPEGKPTIRQVYAIARLLLAESDERWPDTREEASGLIERLRGNEESGIASPA